MRHLAEALRRLPIPHATDTLASRAAGSKVVVRGVIPDPLFFNPLRVRFLKLMSKTLFWYVFKDLLRIFFMASGALAGIMSFGGLLRPLTEHGLDSSQVGRMLTYFTPAMTTYSFPVAALFAATMVYGRLASDNELTATRAGGIGAWTMMQPALVLGALVAVVSLAFLSFIVPIYTLKVEKIVYSNLAQLVQNQIERKHQIELEGYTVFAQRAQVLPMEAAYPDRQRVLLEGPMIAQYVTLNANNPDPKTRVPVASQFWMAKSATAYIERKDDDVQLRVALDNGSHFSRVAGNGPEMNVGRTEFGPEKLRSPIKEDPKFMTITRLKDLYENPEKSQRLAGDINELIRDEQTAAMMKAIAAKLNAPPYAYTVVTDEGESTTLVRGDETVVVPRRGAELVVRSRVDPQARQVKLILKDSTGAVRSTDEALEMRVKVSSVWDKNYVVGGKDDSEIKIDVEGFDVIIQREDEAASHSKFRRPPVVFPMPAALKELRQRTVSDYLYNEKYARLLSPASRAGLAQNLKRLQNKLKSEIHSRASFAVSCLILVMVGCSLGMVSRSGNLLSAFAISFIPAMLCIALIVTGQQICAHGNNSATVGLAFIWSGNVVNAIVALVLVVRLQRQ